jgi:hypothetical protein
MLLRDLPVIDMTSLILRKRSPSGGRYKLDELGAGVADTIIEAAPGSMCFFVRDMTIAFAE